MLTFLLLAVLPRATMPVLDGDAWWHIHAGQEILASGAVPDTNSWTIAAHGRPWVSQDWLSNVLMAVVFGSGDWGVTWLSIMFGVMAAVAFGLLWHASMLRCRPHWAISLPLFAFGLVVAGPIIGVRVQTVDLLLAAMTVWVLWGYLRDRTARWLVGLPLISFAWANLHAGWPLMFLLAGGLIAGEAIDRSVGRKSPDGPPMVWRELGLLAGATGVAAAAIVINPSGWRLYAYPIDAMAITAMRDFLVEWAPPNIQRFEGLMTYAFVGVVVLPLLALAWRQMRTVDIFWLVGLSTMALISVRFALFLGPIGAAVAAHGLGLRLRRRDLQESASTPSSSQGIGGLGILIVTAAAVVGFSLAATRASPDTQADQIGRIMPREAVAWIRTHDPDARIFNTYSWGGYLGLNLPDAQVYIDGRADIYRDEGIRSYAAVLNAWTDPAGLLDAEDIDLVVVRHETPLLTWLETAPGWEVAFEDDLASVWRRLPAGRESS